MSIHIRMVDMRQMKRWFDIVKRSQVSKGVSTSNESGVYRVLVNRSRASIQLVGKGGIEEEIEDNIYFQENERLIPEENA